MDQTQAEEIIRSYLDRLVKTGQIEDSAFAILLPPGTTTSNGDDEPLEVIVVSERFQGDLLINGRDLAVATWEIDTRIEPFPASKIEWENYSDSPKLSRAKTEGKIITLS